MSNEKHALISAIQRYTIHDGPGIRTAVFFAGCNLRCLWCSNPETQARRARLGVYPEKCLSQSKCGSCKKVCPQSCTPVKFDENGFLSDVNMTSECESCLKCAEVCPPRAIKLWGEKKTIPELLTIIESDRDFYDRSGGGVTLTGGEVMLQWEFAAELLRVCKAAGISTCVETALCCSWEHIQAVYEYSDLVITDIKHMDSAMHKEFTGAGNELILENIKKTVRSGKALIIRTPVVFGYNAEAENIIKTGGFIANELECKIMQYQLLPYKPLGTEKYLSLGIPYPMEGYEMPERVESESRILELAKRLRREFGIPAAAGSAKLMSAL